LERHIPSRRVTVVKSVSCGESLVIFQGGWDCTLHVIDEKVFDRFSARFLRGVRGDGAFDAAFANADALVAEAKRLAASTVR
jgi:hypothetical protein